MLHFARSCEDFYAAGCTAFKSLQVFQAWNRPTRVNYCCFKASRQRQCLIGRVLDIRHVVQIHQIRLSLQPGSECCTMLLYCAIVQTPLSLLFSKAVGTANSSASACSPSVCMSTLPAAACTGSAVCWTIACVCTACKYGASKH